MPLFLASFDFCFYFYLAVYNYKYKYLYRYYVCTIHTHIHTINIYIHIWYIYTYVYIYTHTHTNAHSYAYFCIVRLPARAPWNSFIANRTNSPFERFTRPSPAIDHTPFKSPYRLEKRRRRKWSSLPRLPEIKAVHDPFHPSPGYKSRAASPVYTNGPVHGWAHCDDLNSHPGIHCRHLSCLLPRHRPPPREQQMPLPWEFSAVMQYIQGLFFRMQNATTRQSGRHCVRVSGRASPLYQPDTSVRPPSAPFLTNHSPATITTTKMAANPEWCPLPRLGIHRGAPQAERSAGRHFPWVPLAARVWHLLTLRSTGRSRSFTGKRLFSYVASPGPVTRGRGCARWC